MEVRRVPTQARDRNDPHPASRLCVIACKKCTASRAVGPGPGTTVVVRHGGRRTAHSSSVERRLLSAVQHETSRITRLKQGVSIKMELLSRLPVRRLCEGGNLKLSGPGAKACLTQEPAKVAPLAAGRYSRKIQSDNDMSPREPRQA